MTKLQEFTKVYSEYEQKSFALITLLMNNLNPNLSGETAAEINNSFNSLTDSLELMTATGKEAAREQIEQEKKNDRMQILAN